jgi:hypothetical protein
VYWQEVIKHSFHESERCLIVRKFAAMLLLLAGSYVMVAQSAPSAFGSNRGLWVGAEFSDFNPDYNCPNNLPLACGNDLLGAGVVADYQLRTRLKATGEARWLPWGGEAGLTESSYLIGPSYRIWSRRALSLSGKFLAGVGHLSLPQLSGTYFAYAPGGHLMYHYSPRISLFVDYEYQKWPSFSGPPTTSSSGQVTLHNHGLSPNGLSFGAMYRFF